MALKKIYRNVIQFEILSEEPFTGDETLETIAQECYDGSWSGVMLESSVTNEVLEGEQAVEKIRSQGSDPSFFFIDEQGNDLESDDEDED